MLVFVLAKVDLWKTEEDMHVGGEKSIWSCIKLRQQLKVLGVF